MIVSKKRCVNYYPFGLQHRGYNNLITGRQHNYGFNGKEENKELGLEWLDFGARNYSPELGRWMNVDPLADKYFSTSPYTYTLNNPVYFIDPDGMRVRTSQVAGAWLDMHPFGVDVPSDHWQRSADGQLTWISNQGGDTTDTVDVLDQDGNIVSTETMSVQTTTEYNSAFEVDNTYKSPGLREIVKGTADPRIHEADIDDAIGNIVEFIGESLGVDPTITAAAIFLFSPEKAGKNLKGASKGSLSGTKSALIEAKAKINLRPNESLPKGQQGKFGSPQRGNSKKGYRLDPAHPNAKPGSGEEYPHINYWDFTKGKRGKGGIQGAIPIKH